LATDFSIDEYLERIALDLSRTSASSLPDFFILSPPRTGTTWLASALTTHPEIYIPPEKELRYFDVGWQCSDIDFYLERFSAGQGYLKGDASPSYVLLPIEVVALLHQVKPDIKFIVIVRDMPSRAWSNFNHSHAIGEFGSYIGGPAPFQIFEKNAVNYLISDYSTSVGDYRSYLSRWLKYFSVEQFLILDLNDIETESEIVVKRVFNFLGLDANIELPVRLRNKINQSVQLGAPTEHIGQLLATLYGTRQSQQDQFFNDVFGFHRRSVTPFEQESSGFVELFDRADGYKIFIWDGFFYACFIENFGYVSSTLLIQEQPAAPYFIAEYYSELVALIDTKKKGQKQKESKQIRDSERLFSVLKELAFGYFASNTLRTNLASAKLLSEHAGFNLISIGGIVIALRQTLGSVELKGVDVRQLVLRYGPDNVLIGYSADELITAIERDFSTKRALESMQTEIASLSEATITELEKHKLVESRLERRQEFLAQQVSLIVPESGDEPRLLQEDYLGYNLIACAGRVWAVEMAAGSLDFANATEVEDWLANGSLLRAVTVDGACAAVDRLLERRTFEAGLSTIETRLEQRQESIAQRLSLIVPESGDEPRLLQEDYFGYNLIACAGRVWAVEMAAGSLDFANATEVEDWLANGSLLRAVTVDGACAAVDRLLDRRAFEACLSKLETALDEKLTSLASRFERSLEEAAYRSNERFVALERPKWRQWLGRKKNNEKI